MADERDAFLREIDEEVRRERLAKLWDKYGVLVLGAAAAIVVGIAGWNWYQSYQRSQAARAGAQFAEVTKLLADGKTQDATRGLEQIVSEGPDGYAQLATLRLAAQARKDGKPDQAVAHYETLSKNSSADDLLRGFAQLQIAALKLDTSDWTQTKNRLTDLVKDESHWKYAARELLGLAAFKAGKFDQARDLFTQLLASAATPTSIRQRAQLVMALLSRQATAGSPTKAPAKKQDASNGAKQDSEAKTQ